MSSIREVWAPNLDIEMRNVRDLIDKYPFVALVCMNPTHLPVARARGTHTRRHALT